MQKYKLPFYFGLLTKEDTQGGVFIFGTNTKGLHIGGSAKFANDHFNYPLERAFGFNEEMTAFGVPTVIYDDNNKVVETSKGFLISHFTSMFDVLFNEKLNNNEKSFKELYFVDLGLGTGGFKVGLINSCLYEALITSMKRLFKDMSYYNLTITDYYSVVKSILDNIIVSKRFYDGVFDLLENAERVHYFKQAAEDYLQALIIKYKKLELSKNG